MRRVSRGQLVTINEIRGALAKKYDATVFGVRCRAAKNPRGRFDSRRGFLWKVLAGGHKPRGLL
jgi:hypothetical protein